MKDVHVEVLIGPIKVGSLELEAGAVSVEAKAGEVNSPTELTELIRQATEDATKAARG